MKDTQEYDVIVIGAGPAGSTAAALLADAGWRVLVLEKEKFPRYRVGESLMPYCYFTLERLGVISQIKASHFPKKYSVQFVRTDGRVSQPFYFFQHLEHEASTTWQVMRSEFDQILLENARAKGALVREQTRVIEMLREDGAVVGVSAVGKEGEKSVLRAPVTVDASGRDALTMARQGWRVREDSRLNKIAIWTYYKGAMRDPGLDEGATTVAYLPEKGWFWYIPLPADTVSVGVVAEKDYFYQETRDPEAIFNREVENNRWIKKHLARGERCAEFRVTGEYSYRSKYCAAEGLVLAGDAFAFLDPVFSSGVFLALRGGELAADAIDAALRQGDVSAGQFLAYSKAVRQGLDAMRALVYAFYDHEFSFRKLLGKYPNRRGDLTDCLIGNLSKDFSDLFDAVSEFADVPDRVEYGEPLLQSRQES